MKVVATAIVIGVLLFLETLYIAFTGFPEWFPRFFENETVTVGKEIRKQYGNNDSVVLGTNISSSIPVGEVLSLNQSVFLPIVLQYSDKNYLIESSDIENLLGNLETFSKAKAELNELTDSELEKFLESLLKDQNQTVFQKNEDGLKDKYKGFNYYKYDYKPDVVRAAMDLKEVLKERLEKNSGVKEEVMIGRIYRPGTYGEAMDGKYIELDHSKQRVYAWEDGELYKSWSSSGFFDEYAVYGVFEIKNKSKNAFSNYAQKWMPYWMAYYYSQSQGTYFGIHELVYWYDEEGNYIEESSDSIGYQKSGGCVRLDRGEMVELFEWTDVGTPFLIHP